MEPDEEFVEYPSIVDPDQRKTKREYCPSCTRPKTVCWCPALPNPRVQCSTKVLILQSPAENHRPLQTALMLRSGLEEGQCRIIRSRKFKGHRNCEHAELLTSSSALLLYPGPNAVPIDQIPKSESGYLLVLLDGTWPEARKMYNFNDIFKSMKAVCLSEHGMLSEYVVRTQPTDECLSTLESAALAISILENRPEIREPLCRPLKLACQYQLDFGAVVHESRERKQMKAAQIQNGE